MTICFLLNQWENYPLWENLFFFGCPAWEILGFQGGTSGKESTCQGRRCKRHGFHPWAGKIPWRRNTGNSSILVWEIPWTKEPGRLQSLGSQRVQHNWAHNNNMWSLCSWKPTPLPLAGKRGVLTTGLPGKSCFHKKTLILVLKRRQEGWLLHTALALELFF